MVLDACLFASMSFVEVLRSFGLVPLTRRGNPQTLPTSGAISQARARVGRETLAELFRIATNAWFKRPESQHPVFHGLRVCGIDGFTVRLPDTPSNTVGFGVLTSMTDPARFPAAEVAAIYHRRWETETAFDEMKTEQRSARMTLRSKTPDGIHQELCALMLAHNLVRTEMAEVAALLEVEPTRISFHRAVAAIAHHLHNVAAGPPSKLLMYRDFLAPAAPSSSARPASDLTGARNPLFRTPPSPHAQGSAPGRA